MLKKIIVSAMGFALSSSFAFAGASPYIGANLGIGTGDIQLKNSYASTHFGSQGMLAGIFAGYGGMLNQNLYLAGEVFINDGTVSTSTKPIDVAGLTTAKFKTTYSYGVSVMPGIKVASDTLLYVKAGLVRTRFQLEQTPGFAYGLITDTGNTVTGGQLGLGLQLTLSKNLDLRGEYVYTAYQSFNAFDNHISARSNQLSAALVYKFA